MNTESFEDVDFTKWAFEIPAPSAPPINPLWSPAPVQQTMDTVVEKQDCLEWRGDEMLILDVEQQENLFFRRHKAFDPKNICGKSFEFFQSRDSHITYRVNGMNARGPCQQLTMSINNEDIAVLEKTSWLENGLAFALGCFRFAPPLATLGIIKIKDKPKFRILRKVNNKQTFGCTCPSFCTDSEYAIVDQPIFPAHEPGRSPSVISCDNEDIEKLREELRKTEENILEIKMNACVSEKKEQKSLKEKKRRLTAEIKQLWHQLALLRPVARSESILRWWGLPFCGHWEPVRVKVSPVLGNKFTKEEMLAAGLLSVMHILRGLNGPFLRARDEDLGARRKRLSFLNMLDHHVTKEKEESTKIETDLDQHFSPISSTNRDVSVNYMTKDAREVSTRCSTNDNHGSAYLPDAGVELTPQKHVHRESSKNPFNEA